jgi:hypothetical protein
LTNERSDDFSGDLSGDLSEGGSGPYGLGALSRAFSWNSFAASAMAADVPARVVTGDDGFGFKGSGGGARSGSELSHLSARKRVVSGIGREGRRAASEPK